MKVVTNVWLQQDFTTNCDIAHWVWHHPLGVTSHWVWHRPTGVTSPTGCDITQRVWHNAHWVWHHPVGVTSPTGCDNTHWVWHRPMGVSDNERHHAWLVFNCSNWRIVSPTPMKSTATMFRPTFPLTQQVMAGDASYVTSSRMLRYS